MPTPVFRQFCREIEESEHVEILSSRTLPDAFGEDRRADERAPLVAYHALIDGKEYMIVLAPTDLEPG